MGKRIRLLGICAVFFVCEAAGAAEPFDSAMLVQPGKYSALSAQMQATLDGDNKRLANLQEERERILIGLHDTVHDPRFQYGTYLDGLHSEIESDQRIVSTYAPEQLLAIGNAKQNLNTVVNLVGDKLVAAAQIAGSDTSDIEVGVALNKLINTPQGDTRDRLAAISEIVASEVNDAQMRGVVKLPASALENVRTLEGYVAESKSGKQAAITSLDMMEVSSHLLTLMDATAAATETGSGLVVPELPASMLILAAVRDPEFMSRCDSAFGSLATSVSAAATRANDYAEARIALPILQKKYTSILEEHKEAAKSLALAELYKGYTRQLTDVDSNIIELSRQVGWEQSDLDGLNGLHEDYEKAEYSLLNAWYSQSMVAAREQLDTAKNWEYQQSVARAEAWAQFEQTLGNIIAAPFRGIDYLYQSLIEDSEVDDSESASPGVSRRGNSRNYANGSGNHFKSLSDTVSGSELENGELPK